MKIGFDDAKLPPLEQAGRRTLPFEGAEDRTVAVIGDLMLDRYVYGDVERVSPEAPVPVVHHRAERQVPGGAANVAVNLASLGPRVQLIGIVGADEAGSSLRAALKATGRISCDGVLDNTQCPTTQKIRIIGSRQQIARIDIEKVMPLSGEVEARVIAAVSAAISAADIIVISDYGKGLLSDDLLRHVMFDAHRAAKKVLVDPKRRDWTAYSGASIITPNRKELAEASGLPCESDQEADAAVERMRNVCGSDILLTRSEKGMSYYRGGQAGIHVPSVAVEVFDVSGAGDTVIATLAAALALDMDVIEAVKTANCAAGLVVAKSGTANITKDELRAALLTRSREDVRPETQLLSLAEAVELRRLWAKEGLTVGVTNGCFDLLHPGHISLLRQAAGSCDRLVVALNSDQSVGRLKGSGRPIQDEMSRANVVSAIKGVSAVVVFDEDTPLELLRALQPDVLIKGKDYTEEQVVGADLVKARGGRVVLAALFPGHSTTSLVNRRPTKAAQVA